MKDGKERGEERGKAEEGEEIEGGGWKEEGRDRRREAARTERIMEERQDRRGKGVTIDR